MCIRDSAYTRQADVARGADRLLCVANLSASAQSATIDLPDAAGKQLTDLLGGAAFPAVGADGQVTLTLGARGYYWLAVGEAGQTP